jgi:2-methylisocitrate lyase-like PEP mutase family enzyme
VTARLTRRPGGAARLRALLDCGQTIVAPGAFDPLAARLVEEAGFPAVYMEVAQAGLAVVPAS